MDQKETYKKIVEGMKLTKKSKDYKEYLLGLVNELSSEIKANPEQSLLSEEEKNNLGNIKYELNPIGRNPIQEVKEYIIDFLKDKYGRFKVTLFIAILIILSVCTRYNDYLIPRQVYTFINSSCKLENTNFKIDFSEARIENKGIIHLEFSTPNELSSNFKYYLTSKNKDKIYLKEIKFDKENRNFNGNIELDLKGSVELNFILCNDKCNCNLLHSKTLSEFKQLSNQSKTIHLD